MENELQTSVIEKKTSRREGLLDIAKSLFGVELSTLKSSILLNGTDTKKTETPLITRNMSPSHKENAYTGEAIDPHKPMSEYSAQETNNLFRSVFGAGPATQLFTYLTHNSPVAMQRTLALASHEGAFNFHIRNADPNTASRQKNYSTFQLSAVDLPKKIAESKQGAKKLIAGTPMANIDIDAVYDTLDERQKNLFLWVGHIMSRKNPMQIFADLGDPNLSDVQVVNLMSKRIQGGIPDIGHDVVKKTKSATAANYYAQMSKHGYESLA